MSNLLRGDRASGPVVKVGGHAANGHGYNPYRAAGKFAAGPHKEQPKGPGRAPATEGAPAKAGTHAAKAAAPGGAVAKPRTRSAAAAAAKPKAPARTKFDDSEHKAKISAHKSTEAFHRTESLKIAGQQKALREQAKALPKSDKAGRAELKAQHAALGKQREEHRAKATEARTARVGESKGMQEARRQHVASQVAARSGQPPKEAPTPAAHKPAEPKPAEAAPPPARVEHQAKPADNPAPRHMQEHEFDAAHDAYGAKLTSGEEQAALSYSSHHAVDMNRALRRDDSDGLRKYHELIPNLDSAISKSSVSHDTLVFRGITEDPKVYQHYSNMKPGDTYTDKSYTSTSSSPHKTFSGASDNIRIVITVPSGGRAAPIPSVKPQERELLLPRNQKFRVDRIEHLDDWQGKHIVAHVTALQE